MELSKQDIAVIKAMEEIELTEIRTATELGTTSIHIRGKRRDGLQIVALVDTKGNTYYGA